jgi:hypothetical protein
MTAGAARRTEMKKGRRRSLDVALPGFILLS